MALMVCTWRVTGSTLLRSDWLVLLNAVLHVKVLNCSDITPIISCFVGSDLN